VLARTSPIRGTPPQRLALVGTAERGDPAVRADPGRQRVHGNGSGVSRGDRNPNGQLERLRALAPASNATAGIDLAGNQQMAVVTAYDSKVIARRTIARLSIPPAFMQSPQPVAVREADPPDAPQPALGGG
jgi:hypothetical protein